MKAKQWIEKKKLSFVLNGLFDSEWEDYISKTMQDYAEHHVEELGHYIFHICDCPKETQAGWDKKCTCGLDELISKL